LAAQVLKAITGHSSNGAADMICVAVRIGCPWSVQPAVRATSSVQFRTWAAGLCRQVLDQKVFEFLFKTHARIFFEYTRSAGMQGSGRT
jgi:hypothetical protein